MERMQIQIHKVVVTHTHAQIHNTQKAYIAADLWYVCHSHHNWVGDSLFRRGLVTLHLRIVENVCNCFGISC